MNSRKFWMGVLVITLAFSVIMAGCGDLPEDPDDPDNPDIPTTTKAAKPVANVPGGGGVTYNTEQTLIITLTTTETGADIYYTTDGTTPTTSSEEYTDPFIISSDEDATIVLKAITVKSGKDNSDLLSVSYVFSEDAPATVVKPTASVSTGTYTSTQNVTLDTDTEDADIYYINDVSELDFLAAIIDDNLYTDSIPISTSTTLNAFAFKDGVTSGVLTVPYIINTNVSFLVTVGADSGAGSLREALTNSATGGTITITISSSVTTIQLSSELTIGTAVAATTINIQGNGVTIKPSSTFASTGNSLILITNDKTVNINRVHFQSGKDTSSGGAGAAIYNRGILAVNSCIFTLNSTALGGAIYNVNGLTVRGCTFYKNEAATSGGAIYQGTTGTTTLVGNIFYMNTAPGANGTSSGPVVYKAGGNVVSNGYNVSDIAFGTALNQSGFTAAATDKTLSSLSITQPINTTNYRPVGAIDKLITTLPAGFPTTYFNGNPRTTPASPGAMHP